MDFMVIARLSALDKATKPQYIIILNHFPGVHSICSVTESHVCFISALSLNSSGSTLGRSIAQQQCDSECHIVARKQNVS